MSTVEVQQRSTRLALHMLAVPLHCPSTASFADGVTLRQALSSMVEELHVLPAKFESEAACLQVPSGVDYLRLTKVDH